jgi:hypothetical protein
MYRMLWNEILAEKRRVFRFASFKSLILLIKKLLTYLFPG